MLHPSPSVTGSRHVTVDTGDGVRRAGLVVPAAPAVGRAAGTAATACVVPGFGHAVGSAPAPLVERIGRWTSATIGP